MKHGSSAWYLKRLEGGDRSKVSPVTSDKKVERKTFVKPTNLGAKIINAKTKTSPAGQFSRETAENSQLGSKLASTARLLDGRISMIRLRIENGFYDSDEVLGAVAGSIMKSLRADGFLN